MKGKTVGIICVVVAALAYYYSGPKEGITVATKGGEVKGILSLSRDGREFYEWRGIPFGQPPLGDLRFADPLPAKPWSGIRDGSKYGPWCMQLNFAVQSIDGQEDCLYLNVYTPKLQDGGLHNQKKLPVIVHVYGGGYIGKAGEMYPEYFMDEDVVFVTFNYRLASIGFLTTGDTNARGNMGLKDQVLALKWVKENIESFGGDPNHVTIHGISAGAASVHQLTLSKLSKGLFHRAISHSGAATNAWGFITPEEALEKTNAVASELNCPTENGAKILECLRKLNAADILAAEAKLFVNEHMLMYVNKGEVGFVPTIEKIDDEKAFLAEHPLKVVAEGKAHGVPHLIGHTSDEGLMSAVALRRKPHLLDEFESNIDVLVAKIFQVPPGLSREKVGRKIAEFYNPASAQLQHDKKLANYTKLIGDAYFAYDIYEMADRQRKYSPVYFYYYTQMGGPSATALFTELDVDNLVFSIIRLLFNHLVCDKIFGIEQERLGVDHAEDMLMQFSFPTMYTGPGSKLYQFSKDYVRFIVGFAKDLSNLSFRGVKLPKLPKTGPWNNVLEVNENPRIIQQPFEDRMKFLQSLKLRGL